MLVQGEETDMAPEHAVDREVTRPRARQVEAMRAAAAFRVDVSREPDAVRVCPVGELDMATVGRLRARIDEAIASGIRRLILDLRQTTFVDSAGLHLAVDTDNSARRNGTTFAIIAGPPAVHRTFEIAGLSSQLPFADAPRG
jgi:anti-anti-sigma factor